MENKTCSYETLFIVNGSLPEEEAKAVADKFTALIAENGELVKVDEWGKRRLAYPIEKVAEGYYVCAYFNSDPAFPAEFERLAGISEDVMRAMTVRLDKIPETKEEPKEEKVEETAPVTDAE